MPTKKPKKISRAKRAMAVARDVIKRIAVGKISVERGLYLHAYRVPGLPRYGEAQPYIDEIEASTCRVCALGACLLSHVRLFDQFPLSNFICYSDRPDTNTIGIHRSTIEDTLKDVFTPLGLDMIESAFERRPIGDHNSSLSVIRAVQFGAGYIDAPERLKAIMKNIVANKGYFRPPARSKTNAVA